MHGTDARGIDHVLDRWISREEVVLDTVCVQSRAAKTQQRLCEYQHDLLRTVFESYELPEIASKGLADRGFLVKTGKGYKLTPEGRIVMERSKRSPLRMW